MGKMQAEGIQGGQLGDAWLRKELNCWYHRRKVYWVVNCASIATYIVCLFVSSTISRRQSAALLQLF